MALIQFTEITSENKRTPAFVNPEFVRCVRVAPAGNTVLWFEGNVHFPVIETLAEAVRKVEEGLRAAR